MDIELISVEADLLLAKDSDRQAAYIMENGTQAGYSVTGRMNVTRQNPHLAEIIGQAAMRVQLVMVVCQDKADLDAVRTLMTEQVLNREKSSLTKQDILLEAHDGKQAGVILKEGKKKLVLLPGEELHEIFEQELLALLKKEQKAKKETTDDNISLEASVLNLLKEQDLTLTTAESLTGGLLASRFTAVPGASEVFKQGFVTYCNRAKRKLLEVKKSTLKEYGAVSARTAKEMAKNGAFATGSDVCVSLTGLAGPAAEEGKPVGLVYIACCYKNRTVVREYHFKGNRSQIREQSVMQALLLLKECILADQ